MTLDMLGAEAPAEVLTPTPEVPAAQERMFFDKAPKPIGAIYSRDQLIDTAFAYWRQRGFPYRALTVHECMDAINKLALTDDASLMGTDTAYHVADTFHPHRFESSAVGMKAPTDSFADEKLLRRAINLLLEYGQPITPNSLLAVLSMVSGTQACANFRPGFALAIYRKFATTGAHILDTSSGYGGRLVGWMASGLGGTYTGIDPSGKACASNLAMAAALGYSGQVMQIRSPAEDVDAAELGLSRFDLCFTSPPYFTKERYAKQDHDSDLQSWSRYPDANGWVDGFLRPTMLLQYRVLKPGAHSVMNVQDVKVGSKVYPLTEWTLDAAQSVGFEYLADTLSLRLSQHFGGGERTIGSSVRQSIRPIEVASEPVFVFRKPL